MRGGHHVVVGSNEGPSDPKSGPDPLVEQLGEFVGNRSFLNVLDCL